MMRRFVWLAAGLIASGASAKDLPRASPASDGKGCEWAGAGFAKVPGTETCVRVGGSVRADFQTTSKGSAQWK